MYSEFKQMDIDDVAYNYVRDELLNYHNIKQHYANIEDPQDYKQYLFNERESKIAYFHIKFQRIVSKCEHDYKNIIYIMKLLVGYMLVMMQECYPCLLYQLLMRLLTHTKILLMIY